MKALGNVYHSLSDYPRAAEYQQQTLALARKLDDPDLPSRALINLASLSREQGRLDQASQRYRQALVIAEQLLAVDLQAVASSGLGVVLYKQTDYHGAAEILVVARELAQRTSQRGIEAAASVYLGRAHEAMNRLHEAIDAYQAALVIARKLGNRGGELSILSALASAHYRDDACAEAVSYAQASLVGAEALGLAEQAFASLGLLTACYVAFGDNEKALTFAVRQLEQARQVDDRSLHGVALEQIGVNHLALAGYVKAIDAFSEMLQLGLEFADFELESKALRNLGQVYLTLGEPAMAAGRFREQLARAAAKLDQRQIHDACQNLGDPSAAEAALRAAIDVWESIRAGLGTHDVFKDSVFERQAGAYQQLQRVLMALDKADEALEVAERGRARAFVELLARRLTRNPMETAPPPDIAEIRRIAIETRATLVEYSILDGDGPLLVWVVKPSGELVSRQVDLRQGQLDASRALETLVRDGRHRLGARGIERPSGQRVSASRAAIGATASGIDRGSSRRLVLRSAYTAEEPFARLHRLLIEPIGDQATKARVVARLGTAPLVHLATHGILADERGLGSAVALAPIGSDDGLLTAEEILEMDLKADLVVLSACNTGRGRITGDGVIGLSRSFLSAGAASVIVSLWAVPDAPTALLMSEFYKDLKRQPDKAAALRRAMLTTLRQYPNPLDWAGFTLVGESGSVRYERADNQ